MMSSLKCRSPEALPFTEEHAKITGSLVALTRPLGLSSGDRACIALGVALKAPIYTAEKIRSRLRLGIRVHVIR